MILDKENMFSLNRAVTATTTSDVVDLGPVDHLEKMMHEKGFVDIEVSVAAAFAAAADATLVAKLQSSTKETTNWADRMTSEQHRVRNLKAGRRIAVFRLHPGFTDRYLRIRYDITGTVTAGTVTAGIFLDRQSNRPWPKGIYHWLDKDNVLAAWSVRRLFPGNAGPLVRLRRDSSPQAEEDFYATADGALDTQAIADWLTAGDADNAFVVRWYDQSGNNHHADNATAGQQPQLVDDGSVIMENSRPALNFTSDANWYRAILKVQNNMHDALEAVNKPMAVVSVGKIARDDTNFDKIMDLRRTTGGDSVLTAPFRYQRKFYVQKKTSASALSHLVSSAQWPTGSQALVSYLFDGAAGRLYSDDSQVANNPDYTVTGSPDYEIARLGGYGAATPLFRGTMSEVLVYSADVYPQRQDIFGNLKTYYNI